MGYVALDFSIAASRSLISWVTFPRMPVCCYSIDSVSLILAVARQPCRFTIILTVICPSGHSRDYRHVLLIILSIFPSNVWLLLYIGQCLHCHLKFLIHNVTSVSLSAMNIFLVNQSYFTSSLFVDVIKSGQ